MNKDEIKIKVDELDVLCRLYMDCKLSVLEEKELEYILCRTTITSPLIDDVRALMNIQALSTAPIRKPVKKVWFLRLISGIAASVAGIICLIYINSGSFATHHQGEEQAYVLAYSRGQKLNDSEAIAYTKTAMSKADSLMNCAAMIENEYILKAEKLLSESYKNK